MTSTQTLESPPRSGNVTMMTFIAHNPDGSEKTRIPVTKNAVFFGVAAIVLAVIAWSSRPELAQMRQRNEADDLRPAMEKLAREGKEAASLWLVKNYLSENKQRLAELAARGNVEAMYVQGFINKKTGHVESGKHLIAAAAANGYAPAVQDLAQEAADKD